MTPVKLVSSPPLNFTGLIRKVASVPASGPASIIYQAWAAGVGWVDMLADVGEAAFEKYLRSCHLTDDSNADA